jgi:hypothetical protein
VTSRGYGLGQYTLFHHPPTPPEVGRYLLDPPANLAAAVDEYRTKFDGFITGPTDGTRADDRIAEHGDAPLRPCRFEPTDARHLRDCRNCAVEAGSTDIVSGTTPLYPGSGSVYQPTPNYGSADYAGVPVRANFHCDWPYASRRYNGSGIGSYHYQARILRNLLR